MAQQYLSFVDESDTWNWGNHYSRFKDGSLGICQALALAHPKHYGTNDPARVRGPRAFASEAGLAGIRCGSSRIWGYECERALTSGLAADHLFPFSFGGPTLASNKLYLCARHNMCKAGDVHLFPWEEGEPPWLVEVLERVRRSRL